MDTTRKTLSHFRSVSRIQRLPEIHPSSKHSQRDLGKEKPATVVKTYHDLLSQYTKVLSENYVYTQAKGEIKELLKRPSTRKVGPYRKPPLTAEVKAKLAQSKYCLSRLDQYEDKGIHTKTIRRSKSTLKFAKTTGFSKEPLSKNRISQRKVQNKSNELIKVNYIDPVQTIPSATAREKHDVKQYLEYLLWKGKRPFKV